MIERPPAPMNLREYRALIMEHMVYDLDAEILGKTRLLLRPHGGGGRVSRLHPALADYCWYVENAAYLTRAEAAQAVYEGGRSAKTD